MSLLSALLSRFGRRQAPVALPPGLRLYAVGDVHGFADRLDALAGEIARDLEARPTARAEAVLLGDYVDRGPQSAAVLERLARARFPVPFTALRGNHDAMMLDALDAPHAMERWLRSGGDATLRSYGIDCPTTSKQGAKRARTALLDRIPDHHRDFLATTRLVHVVGRHIFVHAGIRPGVALERQSADDLMSIREEFFRAAWRLDGVVVHGHTPRPEPENEPHRVNVDTGVFKFGRLTAAVLEGAGRRFLSVGA